MKMLLGIGNKPDINECCVIVNTRAKEIVQIVSD
jgi:hypothetical protein